MTHPIFSDAILTSRHEPLQAFPQGVPDLEGWMSGIRVPGRLTINGIETHARGALLGLAAGLLADLGRGLQVRTHPLGHEVGFAGFITYLVRRDRREVVSLLRDADGNMKSCITDLGTPLRSYQWVQAWFDANPGHVASLVPVMWEAYRHRPAGVGSRRHVTFVGQDTFRTWAITALTDLLRRHVHRRRMADAMRRALGLDRELLRICRIAGPPTDTCNVEVHWFNDCGRHFWQLQRVAQCAPALLPLMGVLVRKRIWHREPPMAALKRAVTARGASRADWKRLVRARPRTFHDLHALGVRGEALVALAVQWASFHRGMPPDLMLPRQAWLDLAQSIFTRHGNDAQEILRLVPGLGFSPRLRLDAIRRWTDAEAAGEDRLRSFRQNEWQVAIRWIQARTRMDWLADASSLRNLMSEAYPSYWSTGLEELEVDGVRVVPIEDSLSLASEGHELHHCVAAYERDCIEGRCRILGLRDKETDRRIGTVRLQLRPKTGTWILAEAKGPRNRSLPPKLMALARGVARDLGGAKHLRQEEVGMVKGVSRAARSERKMSAKEVNVEIRRLVIQAADEEREARAFNLSGRGHEGRVSLDASLAAVLRGLDLPKVVISGYGANNYYPLRVFQRAMRLLGSRFEHMPIGLSDDQRYAYRISTLDLDDEGDDAGVDDELDSLLEHGEEVFWQDWDSGGLGAGAGRVSVYRYKNSYYVLHDAGLEGSYPSKLEAVDRSGVAQVSDATTAIWDIDDGYVFKRERGNKA